MKYIRIIPLVFLFLYAAKYLFLQANMIDALIIGVLALFTGTYEFISLKYKTLKKDEELQLIREKLKEIEKINSEIKSHFNHVQLGSQIKFNGKR